MCRLAALPPGIHQEEAWLIMEAMTRKIDKDGTGFASWINGEASISKWPLALWDVKEKKLPLFEQLPSKTWSIVHVRKETTDSVGIHDTHPWQFGDWIVCHNGQWSDAKVVRAALGNKYKYKGWTDSEVAASLIAEIGPKAFYECTESHAGVYLAINKDGTLWVIKKGGELELGYSKKKKRFIASDIRQPYEYTTIEDGWYHYDAKGNLLEHFSEKDSKADQSWDFWKNRWERKHPKGGSYTHEETLRTSVTSIESMDEAAADSGDLWAGADYSRERGGNRTGAKCPHGEWPVAMCRKCYPLLNCTHGLNKSQCVQCLAEDTTCEHNMLKKNCSWCYAEERDRRAHDRKLENEAKEVGLFEDPEKERECLIPSWRALERYLSIPDKKPMKETRA